GQARTDPRARQPNRLSERRNPWSGERVFSPSRRPSPAFRRCGDQGEGRSMVTPPGSAADPATGPGLLDPTATAAPPGGAGGIGEKKIQGRSLGQIAWMRLKRDKVAMAGAGVVIVLILIAIFAPLIVKLLGHPPNEFHQTLIDSTLQTPKGKFGGISGDFLFGLEPLNGRDLFSRIVYGSRISLLIA